MGKADPYSLVRLDLNNPVFQENLLSLQKPERLAALDTLNKIRQLTRNQLYRDNGLKWEKVFSVNSPLKNVASAAEARKNEAKKRSLHVVNEHFEPNFDDASASAVVFQRAVKPPPEIDALYSLRITQSRRATAFRDGDFIRLLTIAPDHDSTYGKK